MIFCPFFSLEHLPNALFRHYPDLIVFATEMAGFCEADAAKSSNARRSRDQRAGNRKARHGRATVSIVAAVSSGDDKIGGL